MRALLDHAVKMGPEELIDFELLEVEEGLSTGKARAVTKPCFGAGRARTDICLSTHHVLLLMYNGEEPGTSSDFRKLRGSP
jgi:hypothetical protein